MEKGGRFIEVTKVKCLPLEREGVEKSRWGKITRTRNHSTLGLIEAMGGYNNGYGIVTRKMFIAKRRNSLLRHDLRGPASRYRATRSSFRCNQILRTLCLLIASRIWLPLFACYLTSTLVEPDLHFPLLLRQTKCSLRNESYYLDSLLESFKCVAFVITGRNELKENLVPTIITKLCNA